MLLILDLDETLIHATESAFDRSADFRVGPHFVYRRPHLETFLARCTRHFELAIWSSATGGYVDQIATHILPSEVEPRFVWARDRCTRRFDAEMQTEYWVKDLKKTKRLGRPLSQTLIVDDTPQKAERNYGNAIHIRPFEGDPSDTELQHLASYLESLASVPDVRCVEKRGWRRRYS